MNRLRVLAATGALALAVAGATAAAAVAPDAYARVVEGTAARHCPTDHTLEIGDPAELGTDAWGLAWMEQGEIWISDAVPDEHLTRVVAHECAHLLQWQAYAGEHGPDAAPAALRADMDRIYGTEPAGLEQNADCIAVELGYRIGTYAGRCTGARGEAARQVLDGRTAADLVGAEPAPKARHRVGSEVQKTGLRLMKALQHGRVPIAEAGRADVPAQR